ncbi:MAG: hypothetical protein DME26_11595 [Verrucomicrobia bacterium]|nr:MAG: hypothetical protein DME26_11595 [Verrucomicrobiota bacterium]
MPVINVRVSGYASSNLREIWPSAKHSLVLDIDFSDSALVLVGHGSTLKAESSAPTYRHADELRRRQIFAQVGEKVFWSRSVRGTMAHHGTTEAR